MQTKYLVLFQTPEPEIVEVEYDPEKTWVTKKTGNTTSMYPSSTINKEPNKLCDTEDEAKQYLSEHREEWMKNNKDAIHRHNIETAIHKIMLKDGIYNPRNTPFVVWRKSISELLRSDLAYEVERLMEKYPDGCIAHAYETSTTFFFTETIKLYHVEQLGDGFNYGSTNLLLDCPTNLLILAEND